MRLLIMAFFASSFFSNASLFNMELASPTQNLLLEFGHAPVLSTKSSPDFVLTSWNIYKGGMDGVYDDLEYMIEQSDFVLLQEFLLGSEQEEQIEKLTHLHWAVAKSFKDSGEWTGVATVSKWQPYESLPVRSPGAEPFSNTPKMSLITKYKLNSGEELWIVNTHALNFDITHQAFKDQIDSLKTILETHQGPMIFAGDFNTWSDVRREYLIQVTESLGLVRADIENPLGFLNATLDHLFYRGFSHVEAYFLTEVSTSDHNPLRLEFTL
jgi:endonuclease/exonuclease/phosphatase (EEP) superfamily protein YafD